MTYLEKFQMILDLLQQYVESKLGSEIRTELKSMLQSYIKDCIDEESNSEKTYIFVSEDGTTTDSELVDTYHPQILAVESGINAEEAFDKLRNSVDIMFTEGYTDIQAFRLYNSKVDGELEPDDTFHIEDEEDVDEQAICEFPGNYLSEPGECCGICMYSSLRTSSNCFCDIIGMEIPYNNNPCESFMQDYGG